MKRKWFVVLTVVNIVVLMTTLAFGSGAVEYMAESFQARIYVDGEEMSFRQPVVSINDRTYVPLRELSENMDLDVEWNGEDSTISLTHNVPLLKLSVFVPGSSYGSAYLITVYENGKYKISYGTRNNDDIASKGYLHAEKTETRMLWPGPEMQEIRRLLNEISPETDYSDRHYMTDWWDVDFYYDGTVYQYNYSIQNAPYGTPHMTELINKLLDLSPMELDIHGFA